MNYYRCVIRFPSTNIKIVFQVLIDGQIPVNSQAISELLNSNRRETQSDIAPRVNAGAVSGQFVIRPSPCPSPTGTLRFSNYSHSQIIIIYSDFDDKYLIKYFLFINTKI